MRARIPLLALAFSSLSTLPAAAEWDVDGIEELLPHHETERERLVWQGIEDQRPQRPTLADPPPTGPVRGCAEWEPTTGVLLRYPLGLPYNLLRDMDDDVTLHVVVSSGSLNSATNNLTNNGVDMSQVEFLVEPNESIWTRDYGPWFVIDGNDQVTVIDHVYNRPFRPNDNLIPIALANQQGYPVISHDMWHTGGNYMTEGAAISSSTELVYNEASSNNGMSEAQVDQLMADYYGVSNYEVLDYIESGGIHHIDTWAKFLDEETVLVKDVWTSHHTYDDLNQRATLLSSLPSSTGRNYDVHRVYCYNIGGNSPASYTNSLVLNENVYVPTFGNTTYDNDALAAYEAAMPGYVVRGYYYSGFISDDALHCRTKGIMDAGMLRVAHVPVLEDQNGEVLINAFVKAYSGDALTAVELHYRQDGGWNTIAMSPVGGDEFEATIPAASGVGTTDYYIHAEDTSGRSEGMPRVEPAHWYSFENVLDPAGIDPQTGSASAELKPNFPNPFTSATSFQFELAFEDQVELSIFDAQGRRVRTLIQGSRPAGLNTIEWDGRDDSGRELPAGVYQYRLQAAGMAYSRPAHLLR